MKRNKKIIRTANEKEARTFKFMQRLAVVNMVVAVLVIIAALITAGIAIGMLA